MPGSSKTLVTGGGGFLGGEIVRLLLARGNAVRSFSRQLYPSLESQGVEQQQGDLADPNAVRTAVKGCDVVYHAAAKAGVWGSAREYYRANVLGTQNILAACQSEGITKLVFTSSPSVTFAGVDQNGVDESEPYPPRFLAHYPRTKAIAEQAVLSANCRELATVALRPHLIWGPGDPHLIPRLIERARKGKLKRIGKQVKLVDTIYVENAARAHLQAADRLAPGSAVAGKAYFLSQGEPMPLWDFINRILELAELDPIHKTVPAWLAYTAGAVFEGIYGLLQRSAEPPMTRFVARQLSTAHWFDLSAARRDLGYVLEISTEEGLLRLGRWLEQKKAWFKTG